MELKKSIEIFGLFSSLIFFILITEITGYAVPYSGDDYDQQQQQQGLRELLDEIERQGGLTAPIVPRSPASSSNIQIPSGYLSYYYPNHKMARKSQRSNTLRLRFGKRSLETAPEGPIPIGVGQGHTGSPTSQW